MKFSKLKLKGAFVVEMKPAKDKRGSFGRFFCEELFRKKGLSYRVRQANISSNKKKGTLRGMHYQKSPRSEAKLVTCLKGAIHDVILDLRPQSKTFGKWQAVKLTEKNQKMLYIPEGFAHGFQTLEKDTVVGYQMFQFYSPKHMAGVRYNDKLFKIKWPLPVREISKKDKSLPDYPRAS